MAHASLDSHLDFFSLLSMAHLGVVEPEVSWASKERQAGPTDHQKQGRENCQQHTPPCKESAPMLSSGGGPVQPVNGLYKGQKRSRDQVGCAPDEAAQFPDDAHYVIKRSCPEMRTHSTASHTHLPPIHNGTMSHPHLPLAQTGELTSLQNGTVAHLQTSGMVSAQNGIVTHLQINEVVSAQNGAVPPQEHAMDMDHQPEHSTTNGHSVMEQCACNGRGGKRKVQFCTGMIEEVMSSSQLGVSSLVAPCARCQCGQSGHLDHLAQTTSVMDTS